MKKNDMRNIKDQYRSEEKSEYLINKRSIDENTLKDEIEKETKTH